MFKTIRKVMDTLLPPAAGIFLLIGVLATITGTAVRTLNLGISVTWVEETTRYCIIWGTMLLIGIGFRNGLHTQLTILKDRLQGKNKDVYMFIIYFISLIFFLILLVGGVQFAEIGVSKVSSGLGISMAYAYSAIPVGAGIAVIELIMMVIEFIKDVFDKSRGDEDEDVEEVNQ